MSEMAGTKTIDEVRAHVGRLRAEHKGTWRGIAQAAGISPMTLHGFMSGKQASITEGSARALMDVGPADLSPAAFMDANGAKWRLRALVAMGHSAASIAAGAGTDVDAVRDLIRGDAGQVSRRSEARYREVYAAWWDRTPPARSYHEHAAVTRQLSRAAREGWPTGMALDDDELDQPGYSPGRRRWLRAQGRGEAPPIRGAYRQAEQELEAG